MGLQQLWGSWPMVWSWSQSQVDLQTPLFMDKMQKMRMFNAPCAQFLLSEKVMIQIPPGETKKELEKQWSTSSVNLNMFYYKVPYSFYQNMQSSNFFGKKRLKKTQTQISKW